MTTFALVALVAGGLSLLRYLLGLPLLLRHFRRARVLGIPKGPTPAISLLKPLYGGEPGLEENLVATLRQNYPDFEVLFVHERQDDPALRAVEAARRQVSDVEVRTIAGCDRDATNPKAAVLIEGERHARHGIVASADSDVRPDPLYLRDIANGLQEADAVSFAPVLFGARGFWSRAVALVVNTDGFLMAVTANGRFTTGATIGVRREALQKIGGYRAVADRIADDYALGQALKAAGCKLALARRAARLFAPEGGLGWVLRWLRTVRVAAPWAYLLLLPGTVAPLLLLLAFTPPALAMLGGLLVGRVLLAVAVDLRYCWDRSLVRALPLLPLLWLLEPLGWLAGLFGSSVVWRGRRYRLKGGRAKVVEP